MTNNTGPHCHRPLIEIDHYGEQLIGCRQSLGPGGQRFLDGAAGG
jgi:hypothetical protein